MLDSLRVEDADFAVTLDDDWCSLEVRSDIRVHHPFHLINFRWKNQKTCAVLHCVKDTVNFNVFSNGNPYGYGQSQLNASFQDILHL